MAVPQEDPFFYEETCEGGVKHEVSYADGEGLVCAGLCHVAGKCISNGKPLEGRTPAQSPEAHLTPTNQSENQE